MKTIKDKLQVMNIMGELFHHIVPFKINGKTGKLLVDSGASRTVLDGERFKRFNHKGKICMSPQSSAGVGGAINLQITVLKKIAICKKANIKNYMIGITDLSHINNMFSAFKCEPVDGVLGNDFLMSYGATIDFANNNIQLKFDEKKLDKKNLETVKKLKKLINV